LVGLLLCSKLSMEDAEKAMHINLDAEEDSDEEDEDEECILRAVTSLDMFLFVYSEIKGRFRDPMGSLRLSKVNYLLFTYVLSMS
jgi:hypothetical protein